MQKKGGSDMNKRILSLAIAGMFIFPVLVWAQQSVKGQGATGGFRKEQKEKVIQHRQEQKQENKAFRETLKDKTPEEKKAAVIEHHETQYKENKAFREQLHTENMTFLKDKLAGNKKLTDSQKSELTNFFETQYQENVSYRDKQHSENVAFFQQIANDSSLTQEQKKAAIKDHFATQKTENKQHVEEQKTERKDEKQKIHSEVKTQATANQGTTAAGTENK